MSIDPIVPPPAPAPWPAMPPLAPSPLPPGLPPLPPALAQAIGGPLTAEHMEQLAQAEVRARKLRKAAGVAAFNGWTIGVFAGLGLLITVVSSACGGIDFTGLVMTVGLSLVAWTEFKGRKLLLRFDLRAPRLLGLNQVCLLVLILGYCAWMIGNACLGPNLYDEMIKREPMVRETLGSLGDMYVKLSVLVYACVAVATLAFQGLNALYYFSRAKILRAYLNETPPWIVEVQRRAAGA